MREPTGDRILLDPNAWEKHKPWPASIPLQTALWRPMDKPMQGINPVISVIDLKP